MKLAIISDTHDNIPNIKKVLDYCRENKIEKIIHCGDLAEVETLKFFRNNFSGDIFVSFGNMDRGHCADQYFDQKEFWNFKFFRTHGEVEIANKKMAFVHFPEYAKKLAEEGRFDFVFYGHTHKPWTEIVESFHNGSIKKCEMLNPGNVANQHYPPTFAVYDSLTEKFELVRINGLK